MLKEGQPSPEREITPEKLNEKTLLVFKPDSLDEQTFEDINKEIEQLELEVSDLKEVQFDEEKIFKLWPNIYGHEWIDRTIYYLTSKSSLVGIVQGKDCINKMLTLKKGLRKKYPSDDPVITLIHTSDSIEEFQREYKIFYEQEDGEE